MDFLDFWNFNHALNKISNKIFRLICSVIFGDNKSCDYKTQGFGLLINIRYDKALKQKPSTTSTAVYQHELDDDPSIHDEEDDYLDDNFVTDGIDTPSDDIYNAHNTNFKRNPHVNSLMPRKSPGKSKTLPGHVS